MQDVWFSLIARLMALILGKKITPKVFEHFLNFHEDPETQLPKRVGFPFSFHYVWDNCYEGDTTGVNRLPPIPTEDQRFEVELRGDIYQLPTPADPDLVKMKMLQVRQRAATWNHLYYFVQMYPASTLGFKGKTIIAIGSTLRGKFLGYQSVKQEDGSWEWEYISFDTTGVLATRLLFLGIRT